MKVVCMCIAMVVNMLSLGAVDITIVDSREVTHFFTHSLISYPDIAFAHGNQMRRSYDADCVTVGEFKAFLTQLYERNYVLIDLKDTYTSKGKAMVKNVKVPKNKKPLVLSFDDVNYYVKKMHFGMCDKLIVSDGQLATYTKNARTPINFDNEHVTVLENFIKRHPDFSYNNARGALCLTGFDGILGYRTQSGSPNRSDEIAKVKAVVQALKDKGWTFACHGYGHYHMNKISVAAFVNDTRKWKEEVESIVGKTDVYCYPYGEYDIGDSQSLSAKQQSLVNSGYRLFLGVGERNFYSLAPWQVGAKQTVLLMDRKPLDGISLRGLGKAYRQYIDCEAIYDKRVRFVPYG